MASIPGCLIGGYLCTRFRHRTVYMSAALAYAVGEAAMALAPHTPAAYVTFVIVNALILGVAWGPLTAIIFDCLGPTGAATVGTILTSASNVPVLVMAVLLGHAETRLGAGGMLLTEAVVAVVSIAGYAALAWWWKPGAEAAPILVAAV
jgi:predicted MFS family arabinose efflux permease